MHRDTYNCRFKAVSSFVALLWSNNLKALQASGMLALRLCE